MIYPFSILFFLMLVFPFKIQIIKLLLMAISLFMIVFNSTKKNVCIKLNKPLLLWMLIYLFNGVLAIFIGFFRNNPATERYISTYIIWVVVYILYVFGFSKSLVFSLLKIQEIAFFIIIIMGFGAFFFINFTGKERFFTFMINIRPGGYGIKGFHGPAVTTFIYLFIYYFCLFLISNNRYFKNILFFISGIIFIVMTGRRVIFLLVLIAPIMIYIFISVTKKSPEKRLFKKNILLMSILLLMIVLLNNTFGRLNVESIITSIRSAYTDKVLDNTGVIDYGLLVRAAQINSLIEGWKKNPVFGAGAGINASVIRSDIPGTYEMTYHAMLFERGVFGTGIFVFLILFINFYTLRIIKYNKKHNDILIATIVAFDCFLIANGTNPYLGAYDHMWILFMPIALLNILIQQSHQYENERRFDTSIK